MDNSQELLTVLRERLENNGFGIDVVESHIIITHTATGKQYQHSIEDLLKGKENVTPIT
ncbi:MAG: hypothetical protein KBB55_00390 [Candidatus Buchananbacteria bacterium]|nr:hypothetical protein [Candidatus Buchananbacteria bacterium]